MESIRPIYWKENLARLLNAPGQKGANLLKENGFGLLTLKDKAGDIAPMEIADFFRLCEVLRIAPDRFLYHPVDLEKRLAAIPKLKLILLDVDGVLSDGGMFYTEKGDEVKRYDVKDGRAIVELVRKGYEVRIISAGRSPEMVYSRAEKLGIKTSYVGLRPKLEVYREWLTELNLSPEQVAMIGDDVNDLGVMAEIGLSVCPADAAKRVRNTVDVVLTKPGGHGAVREFVEEVLGIEI